MVAITNKPRPRSLHFHIPAQLLLGLFFLLSGTVLLLKELGRDYAPFIPQRMLLIVVTVGSIIGGFYLIVMKIWRPRIYI